MPTARNGYYVEKLKVPSVTTIIGRFKESGGLLHWAFDQGKAAERGEIKNLYDKRDEAGNAGTLGHSMVEAHINFGPMPEEKDYPPDIWKQARQGFENYLEWEANNKIVIVHQELQLVSKEHLYGGCPDAIGRDTKGRLCLVDWKTSNNIFPEYLLQLSAYSHLWDENYPDNKITGGYHLCRFSKEHGDFAHHFWSELDQAWELFLLYRTAYDLDRQLKKRAK